MSTITLPVPPNAKATDYSDAVALLEAYSAADAALKALDTKLNAEHLELVREHLPAFKRLQSELADLESALVVLAERNPQWFAKTVTVKTPVGHVKQTSSTKLEIADEKISITLIEAAGRGGDFVKHEKSLDREALEKLPDEALAKFGIARVTTKNYKLATASVDLGAAVKAQEKEGAAANAAADKTARRARRESSTA